MSSSEGERRRARATQLVRSRYNHMASLFDLIEKGGGQRLRQRRELLWSKVDGIDILEVGVGTGANFPYYPANTRVTAIDLSSGMLDRSRRRTALSRAEVVLQEMDVQSLSFPDETFDAVVATLVLCAVPDPVKGLAEMKRVCRSGCKALLLEHVRSSSAVLGPVMDFFNPAIFWAFGDNFNRRTVDNVAMSGFVVENVTELTGIFKLIEAKKA